MTNRRFPQAALLVALLATPVTVAACASARPPTRQIDDAAITAENPGVKLSGDIVVVRRSDSSGTTQNFTGFLNKAAGPTGSNVWTLKSGSTVEWPTDTQGGNGNTGVAQIIKDTKGAIGYVDYSDAKATGLKFAAVKNKAGKYVEPTADSASAAGDGVTAKDNLTFKAINADGDKAYPITYQTYVIVYAKQTDKAKDGMSVVVYRLVTVNGKELPGEEFQQPLRHTPHQQQIFPPGQGYDFFTDSFIPANQH